MTSLPDLAPAARRMADLVAAVTDDQLAAPTPCEKSTIGDLIDHVDGLSLAFTWAAEKKFPEGPSRPPSADASRLGGDWRTRIPQRLAGLAEAWRSPEAWQGMTQAGGLDLPGEVAGRVALNELVVHGWDIARAVDRPYGCEQREIDVCLRFVGQAVEESGGRGVEGLFGPVVEVSGSAPVLDRMIGLTGRDPAWTPAHN